MSRAFPPFLAPDFEAATLGAAAASIAAIAPDGDILWVNPAWEQFARNNDASSTFADGSYFDRIAPPLREFYQAVFANALLTGEVFSQEYECSSPEKRRHFHFRAMPIQKRGLLLEHSLVAEDDHEGPSAEVVASRYQMAGGIIVQCSNCRRVQRPETNAWDWVPRWVSQSHPKTSHAICHSCVGYYWGVARRRT